MLAFRAQVRHGRSMRDEPTKLPDGAQAHISSWGDDELDEHEREELGTAIAAAERELDAGRAVTEDQLWAWLGAIPVAAE